MEGTGAGCGINGGTSFIIFCKAMNLGSMGGPGGGIGTGGGVGGGGPIGMRTVCDPRWESFGCGAPW